MKYRGFAAGKPLRSVLLTATLLPPLALMQMGCEADNGAGPGQKVLAAVRVIAVAPQDFEQTLLLTGTVEPTVAVALSSPAEGPVVKLAAREGDEVLPGELLVTIGGDSSAEAALAAAEETLETAEREYQRIETLVAQKLLSVEQIDNARATRERARSALSRAQQDAGDFRISAPWKGIVSRLYVAEGRYVSPREALLELYDPETLVLRFDVPEQHAFAVDTAQRLKVQFDAIPRQSFSLTIVRAWPELDRRMRTRKFEAELPTASDTFLPGQFARIVLPLRTLPSVITIPTTALLESVDAGNGPRVAVLDDDERVELRVVVTGADQDGALHVRRGLQPGDRVVVEGQEALKDGQKVRLAGTQPQ